MKKIHQEKVPIEADDNGTLRVGSTRVTFSTVISFFEGGATPEDIVDAFGSLNLADVYSVLGYYLRHEAEVRAQLQKECREGEAVRQEIEKEFSPNPLRERLRKKKQELETGSAK